MKNTFVYQTEKSIIKLLQITDPHLFKEKETALLGVNTQASFTQVLKEIQQENNTLILSLLLVIWFKMGVMRDTAVL